MVPRNTVHFASVHGGRYPLVSRYMQLCNLKPLRGTIETELQYVQQ